MNVSMKIIGSMINGICQHGNLIYLSLRTTSGIIAVNKETKDVVFELKYTLSHNNIVQS